MPSAADLSLFLGTTTSPAREFIAERLDPAAVDRVDMPCVGRWSAATAVAKRVGAEKVWASDLSLFSTVIGYLADAEKSLDDLDLTIPAKVEHFMPLEGDEIARGAAILLGTKYLMLDGKNAYNQAFKREVWKNAKAIREQVEKGLREQVEVLAGCHYENADVRAVVRSFVARDHEGDALYVNLPGYAGGYFKMYGAAEEQIWTCQLATSEFDPAESLPLLESMTESKGQAFAYVHHGDSAMPEDWTKLLAVAAGPGRVDYIVSNQDRDGARMAVGVKRDNPPKKWPIYQDQEITKDSVIEFVAVDKDTCLHYRDLFVHRLGTAKAEIYCLMLIDGRVTTAFGLMVRDLARGQTEYLAEVFGISVSSMRYSRLGKLFMLMLTTTEFRDTFVSWAPTRTAFLPRGIKTASPTKHHEGKTDRGVLELVRREERPGGGFQLLYVGDFREETTATALARWIDRFGHLSRPGYKPKTETTEESA